MIYFFGKAKTHLKTATLCSEYFKFFEKCVLLISLIVVHVDVKVFFKKSIFKIFLKKKNEKKTISTQLRSRKLSASNSTISR